MIRLFMQSEYSTWWIALAAILGAASVAWFYLRETRSLPLPQKYLLPALRALAIMMVILMLAGPVIEYRREIGQIPTVHVFVDASSSMLRDDISQNDNKLTRLQRAEQIVLGNADQVGMLPPFKGTHKVRCYVLSGEKAVSLYDNTSNVDAPKSITDPSMTLDTSATDLSDPLAQSFDRLMNSAPSDQDPNKSDQDSNKAATEDVKPNHADTIVLLSDGQHNLGPSPEALAKRLGDLSVPVFTIGLGQAKEPNDLAVLSFNAPSLVAASGRAAGTITVKEITEPGKKYRVSISSGNQVVWEQSIVSEQKPMRQIPFDISMDGLVARNQDDGGHVERLRQVVPLRAAVEKFEDDLDPANNELVHRLAASIRKRRMLIVDSRSRWETRYIRNVFDRDPTWQVDTIIMWPDQSVVPTLDEAPMEFPRDQKTLSKYDVVLWGDVDAAQLESNQLDLVKDFVTQGGGIVFVAGDRGYVQSLAATPMAEMLPVRFPSDTKIHDGLRYSLTQEGRLRPVMQLVSTSIDSTENADAWAKLQAPTYIKDVQALPGSEVWLEAKHDSGSENLPVIVSRGFGAGQVVFVATDQTWRWRYRIADLYHAKFWSQMLESVMQAPFDARDQYVSLAADRAQYVAGERATIRVQLRNAAGEPETEKVVDAVLRTTEGQPIVAPMKLVNEARGIYECQTLALPSGDYRVSMRAAGYGSSAEVTTNLLVTPPVNRENERLAQNVTLLKAMAEGSGGSYADESEADKIWELIKPLSSGRIEQSRYLLAQSLPWFLAILTVLAIEWWLRKKVGLV